MKTIKEPSEFIKSPCTYCKNHAICKYCAHMDEFVSGVSKLYDESTEGTLPGCEIDIKCEYYGRVSPQTYIDKISSSNKLPDTEWDETAIPKAINAVNKSIEDLKAPVSDEEDTIKTKTESIIDEINAIGDLSETTPINKPSKNGSHATPPKPTDTPPDWFRPFDYYGKIITYAEAYSLWSKGLIDFIPGGGSYSPNFIIK